MIGKSSNLDAVSYKLDLAKELVEVNLGRLNDLNQAFDVDEEVFNTQLLITRQIEEAQAMIEAIKQGAN
ncbi:hypothetical protein [Lacticaseibacillus paracasei]|uniref:hypothetical protein n=1 Tax=Lacticaseibacillus paracasei TaxID=1597 RepID=UPI003D06CEA7